MTSSYIIAGCRTPIGKYQKALASLPATGLGAIVVNEALRQAGVEPGRVDEVIMGNVLSASVGQAPARQAALAAGLPATVAALTINKVCGSGLKAVMLADQTIRAGDAECIVAGGMESMSRAPFLVRKGSDGKAVADETLVDSMLFDGLTCAFENVPMGSEAEFIAGKCGISRGDQDAFALDSHRRAVAAWERGDFAGEVVPVRVKNADGGQRLVDRDEGPRGDTSLAALAKLRTPFAENGTVTPGNSSQVSDGAAAVVVASEEFVAQMDRLTSQIRTRIVATATSWRGTEGVVHCAGECD